MIQDTITKVHTKVKSADIKFDEEVECKQYDINQRQFCLSHIWVNASLSWGRRLSNGFVDDRITGEHTPWSGYGPIRFCKKCKIISCIHWWVWEIDYEVEHGKYYSTHTTVAKCSRCDLMINRGGGGNFHPSAKASELIYSIAEELGQDLENYGSGWHCDFPAAVSEILDHGTEEDARQYIRTAFQVGNCESSMNAVRGPDY